MKIFADEVKVDDGLARAVARVARLQGSVEKDSVKSKPNVLKSYSRALRKEIIALELIGIEGDPKEVRDLWVAVQKTRSSKDPDDTIEALTIVLKENQNG